MQAEYEGMIDKQEVDLLAMAKDIQAEMFKQGRPKFTLRNLCKHSINPNALNIAKENIDALKLGGFIITHKGEETEYYEIQTDLDKRVESMKKHAGYLDYLATTYAATSRHILTWAERIKPEEKQDK